MGPFVHRFITLIIVYFRLFVTCLFYRSCYMETIAQNRTVIVVIVLLLNIPVFSLLTGFKTLSFLPYRIFSAVILFIS
jgi:hypothetical protein